MLKIHPLARAYVPVDSEAGARIAALNYDEFSNELEVWHAIRKVPDSILKIAMAHCDMPTAGDALVDGSPEALARAGENFRALTDSPLVREVENALFIYQIELNDQVQTGVGGLAGTDQIRTEEQPNGEIQRNEAIHPHKARSRADLVEAIGADLGVVNLAVEDANGDVTRAMAAITTSRPADFTVASPDGPSVEDSKPDGSVHRVWVVVDPAEKQSLTQALEREPEAFVADGNHRSAAADLINLDGFLAVYFPQDCLRIEPYHRLLALGGEGLQKDWPSLVSARFDVQQAKTTPVLPTDPRTIGFYARGEWFELKLRPEFDTSSTVDGISAAICQQHLFQGSFGIESPIDPRLSFIGGTRPIEELPAAVDQGLADAAITLAPVTMQQFIAVCRERSFMPAKSTWFDPKILSGLVISCTEPKGSSA